MATDKLPKLGTNKIILFSLIPLGIFLILGEVSARVLLCVKNKDAYYLTAPFFEKKHAAKTQTANEFDVDDFFKDGKKNADWYFKMKPGTYPAPANADYKNYTINSLGFRGKEFNPKDKEGRIRIFCLGPSTTFGGGSSDSETWPGRLQYYLDKAAGGRFEVINSGFPGYYSLNYLNILRHELINYLPDMLVMEIGTNDLGRSMEEKNIGKLSIKIHELLYYRSILYTLLTEKLSSIFQKSPIPMHIYTLNADSAWKENLKSIITICHNNNIKVILLRQMLNTAPEIFLNDNMSFEQISQAQKDPTDRFSKAYSSPQVIYRYNAITAVFRETSAKYNVTLLDFRKEFLEAISDSKESFFSDDVHLTSKGNDLLGKLTAKYILANKPYAKTP